MAGTLSISQKPLPQTEDQPGTWASFVERIKGSFGLVENLQNMRNKGYSNTRTALSVVRSLQKEKRERWEKQIPPLLFLEAAPSVSGEGRTRVSL